METTGGWGGGEAPGWRPGIYAKKLRERQLQRESAEAGQDNTNGASGQEQSSDEDSVEDATAQDTSEGVGAWFPGKYAQKAVKRALWKQSAVPEDKSRKRQDGAPVVGRLALVFKETRGVKLYNPFFSICVEGVTKHVRPDEFKDHVEAQEGQQTSNEPAWEETLYLFDVTDITSDVTVTLLDKRLRIYTIGRLIIPLSIFLGFRETRRRATYTFDIVAAELFDVGADMLAQHYAPQMVIPTVREMKLGTGVHRMPIVGQLVLEIELSTDRNLLQTYFLSRPLDEDSFRHKSEEKPEESHGIDTRQLVINIFRLKQAIQLPPLVTLLLDAPYLFVPLFTTCLRSPSWTFPLWVVLSAFANGWLNRRTCIPDIEAWPQELVETVYSSESVSAPTKFLRLWSLITSLQDQLGRLASLLERSSNLWTYADPHVSFLLEGAALIMALCMSLVLYLVPLTLLLWVVGILIYSRIYLKRWAARHQTEEQPSSPQRQKGGAEAEDRPRQGSSEQEVGKESEVEQAETCTESEHHAQSGRPRPGSAQRLCLAFAGNVAARSPDFLTLVHREWARKRMIEGVCRVEQEGSKER